MELSCSKRCDGCNRHAGAGLSRLSPASYFAKERAAEEAESDAVKARNSSDLLKARQANMKYEVDDLHASLPGRRSQKTGKNGH